MKRSVILALLLWSLAGVALGQAKPALAPADDQTLGDFLGWLRPPAAAAQPGAGGAPGPALAPQPITELLLEVANNLLASKVAGTAAAANFADRVSESVQNFLPLFQGLIDGVSTAEDKKSVTLKFVPLRGRSLGDLAVAATLTEPEASEALVETFPSSSQSEVKAAIGKKLDDVSDITWSATWNYAPRASASSLETRRFHFGRNPRSYERLWAEIVGESISTQAALSTEDRSRLADLEERIGRALGEGSLSRFTGAQLQEELGPEYPTFLELVAKREVGLAIPMKAVTSTIEQLATLIQNQPQLIVTYAYRDRDPLAGATRASAVLTLEIPAVPNLNRLASRRREAPAGGWVGALKSLEGEQGEAEKGTKVSVSVRWVEEKTQPASFTFDGGTGSVARERSEEICGRASFSRRALWQPLMIEGEKMYPDLTLSLEYIRVSGDPMKEKNRLVGNLTYSVPISKTVSFPLSVVYANKSEFLGDPDKQLSAHVGINYRFNPAKP